jgi:hypothetical protein
MALLEAALSTLGSGQRFDDWNAFLRWAANVAKISTSRLKRHDRYRQRLFDHVARQGSQAKVVIVSLIDAMNLDPSWLYTAVTRAEEAAVLVGSRSVLERAMGRRLRFAIG